MAAQTYTVQTGDSLSLISKVFYGDFSMTDAIAKANNISNINLIYPGQKLTLPETAGKKPEVSPLVNQQKSESKVGKYLLYSALIGAGVFFGFRALKKYRSKKTAVAGVAGLKETDVKVGDYLRLDTGTEVAKIKVTSTKDKFGRTEIDGKVVWNGKTKTVAVLRSDFEKGFVKKIKRNTKVKQHLV